MRSFSSALLLALGAVLSPVISAEVTEENGVDTDGTPVVIADDPVLEDDGGTAGDPEPTEVLPSLQALVMVTQESRAQNPIPVAVVKVLGTAKGEEVEVYDRLHIAKDARWPWPPEGRLFSVKLVRPPPPAAPDSWVLVAPPASETEPEATELDLSRVERFEEELKEMLHEGPVVSKSATAGTVAPTDAGDDSKNEGQSTVVTDPDPGTAVTADSSTTSSKSVTPIPLVPDVLMPTADTEHRPDPTPIEREVPDILPPTDPATRVVSATVEVVGMGKGLLVTQQRGQLKPGPASVLRPGDSRGDLSVHVLASDGKFAVLNGDVATLTGTLEMRQTQSETDNGR